MLFNLFLNDLLHQARVLKSSTVLGYADDIIIITPDVWELEKFTEFLKKFCEESLLVINHDKSDIVLSGVPQTSKTLFGFPIRKTAKYLGVTYDGSLSVKKALTAFKSKEKFIFFQLFRVLRQSDFRVRYNLWQIFICPLIRMVVSLSGEPGSQREK